MKLLDLQEARSADNASFADLEDSINPSLSPKELDLWESYSIRNSGMRKWAAAAMKNEDYQEVLEQNLRRIGIPDPVLAYRGHLSDREAIGPALKVVNITTRESFAANFRKVRGIPEDQWTVSKIEIPRSAIIALGNAEEREFIVLTNRAKIR
jgi:hypothetical protein